VFGTLQKIAYQWERSRNQ